MEYQGFAPNETMQIRELLTIKNLILTKSVAMEPFAVDESLKIILQNEIGTTKAHIKELRAILEKSDIALNNKEYNSWNS